MKRSEENSGNERCPRIVGGALEEEHLRAKLIVVADGLKRDDFSPNRLGIPKSGRL
jgi:hypothetical protein